MVNDRNNENHIETNERMNDQTKRNEQRLRVPNFTQFDTLRLNQL